jgi:hypothetical protein
MARPLVNANVRRASEAGTTPRNMQILLDAARHPSLFRWHGRSGADLLDVWLQRQSLDAPADLVAFWRATGGGEAFETEQFLTPIAASDLIERLEVRNDWHRQKGMPGGLVIFHEGLWLSAIRAIAPRYVTLTDHYSVAESYESFDDWYRYTLRDEYALRYGLSGETP